MMGCRYDHVLAFGSISPSTEIVDITLQIMIGGRCVNWVVKQDVIRIKRHSSIRQGDYGDVIDINNEHAAMAQELSLEELNRQDVR